MFVTPEILPTTLQWQVAVPVLLTLLALKAYHTWSTNYVNVPAVGVRPGLFGSWRAGFEWLKHSELILREGVNKYAAQRTTFKVATPSRWIVFVTDPKLIDEIKDQEKTLSIYKASQERFAMEYTLDSGLHHNPYHLSIINKKLTARLSSVLTDVVEEITLAFEENTCIGQEWAPINNYDVMLKCVSRTTNRVFVGQPLCRKQDFLEKVIAYATTVARSGSAIGMFPKFIQPFAARYFFDRRGPFNKVMDDIGPVFAERQKKLQTLGAEWSDKPSDMIQWIVEAAPPGATVSDMCMRLLFFEFAAIHTSTLTITQALFDLAAHSEYQNPLKEEIESSLQAAGGWTKQALTKMKKLDSVMRESQRVNGVTIATVVRRAMQRCRLSDGTILPKGTFVCSPTSALHHSDVYYENPMQFDGFRYSKMREQPGHEAMHQVVSVDTQNLGFGLGTHACPGRFFASNELKVLLAYIICNYEFKTADGQRPENHFFHFICAPDFSSRILFKERKDRDASYANLSR